MVRTTLSVSEKLKSDLEKLKGNIGWEDFLRGIFDSELSLRQKHVAMDRELKEIKELNERLKGLWEDGKKRFEDAEKNVDVNFKERYNRLEDEVRLLRELNKLNK